MKNLYLFSKLKSVLYFVKRFGFFDAIPIWHKIANKQSGITTLKIKKIKVPFVLRNQTSDVEAFKQVFINKEYDIPFDTPPSIIIDGGANIGMFSIDMKNRFPDSKIIAIEPDQSNFNILSSNLSSYDDVFCEEMGIWNKDCMLKVYDKYQTGKWGMVVEEVTEQGNVYAITIRSIMNKYQLTKIDVLKLDIETSEKAVFSKNFHNWLPYVRVLIVELHDQIEKGCSKPFFSAINEVFSDYSYSTRGENTIIVNHDPKLLEHTTALETVNSLSQNKAR